MNARSVLVSEEGNSISLNQRQITVLPKYSVFTTNRYNSLVIMMEDLLDFRDTGITFSIA